MNREHTYTLITGSGSGIGKALAWYCGSKKMNRLLVSLPGENLETVARDIRDKYAVSVDFFETDLAKEGGPVSVYNWVRENNYRVNILINNAGIAGTAVFENSDPSYSDLRIMLNIRALVLLTRYFLPELKKMDSAYILNVGSLSAFFSIPYKAVYSASKAFVVNFSRALRYELKNSGVSISVVCPNGVRTNTASLARIDSHGIKGKLTSVPVDVLAKNAVDNMLRGKFLYIPGRINRALLLLSYFLPGKILQKFLGSEFMKEVKVS